MRSCKVVPNGTFGNADDCTDGSAAHALLGQLGDRNLAVSPSDYWDVPAELCSEFAAEPVVVDLFPGDDRGPDVGLGRKGPGGVRVGGRPHAEARNAGVTPLHRGDPGYAKHLDRDGDGIACE